MITALWEEPRLAARATTFFRPKRSPTDIHMCLRKRDLDGSSRGCDCSTKDDEAGLGTTAEVVAKVLRTMLVVLMMESISE